MKNFLRKLADQWWERRRKKAAQTIEQAYLRHAPKGQPPSADAGINNYYAALRAKQRPMTAQQHMAEQVRQQTLARASDQSRKPDWVDEHGMGHFDKPTVRVTGMLPDMGADYDDMTPAERLQHQQLRDPDYEEKK